MPDTLSIDFDEPLPLFPLPGCVLLPHVVIPLHIFEARYRRMVADAIDARKLLCMAVFEGQDWKRDYQGAPPVRSHVCVGYIVQHEKLPDGRFNILLQGVCRARIEHQLPGGPYRRALVRPTELTHAMDIDLDEERRKIEQLLADPLLQQLQAITAVNQWLKEEVSTVALVDLASMQLCDQLEPRYQMLVESDALLRARRLESFLRDTRRTVALAEKFPPRDLPDHLSLN